MSPWNIISKFTTKRPVPVVAAAAVTSNSEIETIPVLVNEVPDLPIHTAGTTDQDEVADNVGNATTHEEPDHSIVAAEDETWSPLTIGLPTSETPVAVSDVKIAAANPQYDLRSNKKVSTPSRVSLRTEKNKTTRSRSLQAMEAAQTEYLDAVYGLDGDIKELRAALAEKLETQNEQLRAMLSRFSGS